MSYRVDFWMNFAVTVGANVVIAYFLWKAIFDAQQATEIAGYNFLLLMLYYLLVPMYVRIVIGPEMGYISDEIYQGSLNRYLVYPVPFFVYKYITYLASSCIAALQLFLVMGIYILFFGVPTESNITIASFCLGLFTALCATYLYFVIAATLELVAFWADNVWSLMVMLRFSFSFLGGGLLPLAFFPQWAQTVLSFLPFPYLLSLPIETSLGKKTFDQWLCSMLILFLWAIVFSLVVRFIWKRGTYRYSGVGI